MSVCYIVGAGECDSLPIEKKCGDIVIAADGGLKHLEKFGVTPDIIIGDFDSLGLIPEGDRVIRLKPEKDVTDMFAAVEVGMEYGCDSFEIFGSMGGRIDHSLANIQLAVSLAEKRMAHVLRGNGFNVVAVKNGGIPFFSDMKGYVSVFSHSDVCKGVRIKGLKYELENAELTNNFALGVSNEFIGKDSSISVENGTLVIVYGYSL
ncbi:MAG: thiamine diphosphokinase [Clostridia bacterium]|nr:thiamine diphosphokinase [Clostridia bacterium]